MRWLGVLDVGVLRAPAVRPMISRRNVPAQVLWYLLVGALSFGADLVAFRVLLSLGLVTATVLGFALGTLVNYVLSTLLAFSGARHGRVGEILRLVVVALIGAGLTVGLVLALTAAGLGPTAAKLGATVLVFAWNYVGRRIWVFGPEMPDATWAASNRSLEFLARQERAYD
jgi:putative flippase GtrA